MKIAIIKGIKFDKAGGFQKMTIVRENLLGDSKVH
jgi:hypothetical protein